MSRFAMLCLAMVSATVGPRSAVAENFRIDNTVSVGQQSAPTSESTTIFHDGLVFDFMKSPAETVVFDKSAGRFTLLHRTHRKQADLTTTEITSFLMRLRQKAVDGKDPLARFLAAPKFREGWDEAAGELTLDSPLLSYRITLSTEAGPNAAEQYHDFCDWYARLNAMLVPGSLPPFGRLVANAAMAQRQSTASRVVLTIQPGDDSKPTVIRSEHKLSLSLDSADLDRLAQARRDLANFKRIDFNKYRKLESR